MSMLATSSRWKELSNIHVILLVNVFDLALLNIVHDVTTLPIISLTATRGYDDSLEKRRSLVLSISPSINLTLL